VTARRPLQALVLVAAIAASAAQAWSAPVEIRVRTMLREKPASSARILDRIAAGKKLPMLGKSDDGRWVHVRSGPHDGWIQAAAVKGMRGDGGEDSGEAAADDEEPVRPMAKARGVRPEAWVSKSRYHDGEDLKLIVSVNKAELFGRPSATGAVLGILRRGEQVSLVKKSVDKKWINVDIGGGETAWIEARAVKPGKVTSTPAPEESAQEEEAPPPTITPEGAKKKAKMVAKVEKPPEPEQQAEEPPPPPPPPKKTKKQQQQAKVEAPPPPPPEEPKRPPRNIEDEAPPGLGGPAAKPSKSEEEKPKVAQKSKRAQQEEAPPPEEKPAKKRKLKKLASRTEEPATAEAAEAQVVKDSWTTRGKVYLTPAVRAGIAILSQRFTSNGTGPLTNYESSTNAFGAQVGLGVWGTVGKYFLLGGDASYTFAGAASLKYISPTDGSAIVLPTQSHTIDGGLSAGLHFSVLGGLSVRLRLGGQMVLNLIQPEVRTKLPSDRILGMTIGAGAGAPALFYLGGRPFGIQIFGGGVVPAQRAQTVGLEDGAQSTTYGAFFGGGVSYVLMAPNPDKYRGQLAVEFSYAYEFVATHYTGVSRRNNTINVADRGSAQHLIALGVGWYY
jgi:uncharacterized protein YgiM (DUF1202 family)